MSTWRGIEDMPVLEKPLHDPNANAPFDIPEHEKEKAQRMWDHIFQNSPDMNTVLLKANPLDGSADPDDAHIITFCVPFEPRKPSTLKETKYEVLNGVVTLEAVDDAETPRASYSFKQETLHHLCLPCLDAFDYFFQYLKDKKSKNDDEEQSNHRTKPANAVVHHFSAVSLMLSDKKNCYLCRQLLRQLPEHFTKTPWLEKARLEMCWSGGVDSSEPFALFFAVCRPDWTRNQWNYYNYFKLRMWPANSHAKHFVPHESANTTHEADLLLDASRSLFSEENPDGLRIMGVDPRSSMNLGSDCNPLGITAQMQKPAIAGSSTNSIRTKQLALQWFSHCRQNKDGAHNECNIRLGTTLPARLLDVERALKTGMLTLINTKDQPTCFYIEPQPYVTLSYCWGEGGKEKLPLLLSTNLLERETIGLKLADLPRTIRDAVEISSWFNAKWLWIDCLTILQDSTTDWDHESELMTQTYRNAVLNISADASINAFGGCFKGRDPLDSTPLKMSAANIGLSWWLTPDKRYQFAWMQEAPTFARAWVHRERQLSPRILHFTNNEVIWECTGSPYSSEIYPGGAPFQGSFNGDNKYQIISLLQKRKNKKMHGLDQVYETWNEVCDKFSIKRISFPTDMPVVVAGVAEEFAAMLPADEYVAGLWRSTLPQSLLWTRTGGPERPKDYIAPSWSWISTGTSTKQRYRGYQHPILAVRDIELKRKSSHVFGALEYGALKVTGILRHIHLDHLKIVERTGHLNFELSVDERGVERLLGTSQNEYDGPLCQIWSDYIVKRTWQSVYCLFVAIRHFTGAKEPRTITALLLEKDESEGNDGKTFKRVGMMHFADLFSLKVRYQVRPGFEGTEDKWKQLQAEIEEAHKGKKEEDYPIKQPASLGEIDPMDVYQFDVAGEFDWVERLTPEDVTLI